MACEWMEHVPTRSLDRGGDYFAAGLVSSLSLRPDGWRANVLGSESYSVFIPSSKDPRQSACTCPHYADGNICKHIAAVLIAIESKQVLEDAADENLGAPVESAGDILDRMDEGQLRAFLGDAVSQDAALERRLRGAFGSANLKAAMRDLQKTTTDLMRGYERGGFIDWRDAADFESEYSASIDAIIQPFVSAKDADALCDLAVKHLVQLQRICIDDSDGFFTSSMYGVVEHLDFAYSFSDADQRVKLFESLADFASDNPGRDRGEIYWFERDVVEEYLIERFSFDERFAERAIKLADERCAVLSSSLDRDPSGYDGGRWSLARLNAMFAMGLEAEALLAFAEDRGLLDMADAVHVLADAYERDGRLRDAADLLLAHVGARDLHMFRHIPGRVSRKRIVDRLVEVVAGMDDTSELAALYVSLLISPPRRDFRAGDYTAWYDALCQMLDKEQWERLRSKLLEDMPNETVHTCLAHEGSVEELYKRIVSDGNGDLMRFENVLCGAHPEPYVDYYLDSARWHMEGASDRRAYRHVAECLAHAAGMPGGELQAGNLAREFKERYPRRSALMDELAKAGFVLG